MRLGADGRTGAAGGPRRARLGALAAGAAIGALLGALLGGCGGDEPVGDALVRAPEDAASVARAALEEAGTFAFEATYVRIAPDGAEPERYGTSRGAVDLAADVGRMELSLVGLPAAAESFELTWDEETLLVRAAGDSRALPRAEAREEGGLVGRYPDEPEGLFALLALAREPEELGSAVIGGRETTGYRFAVDRRAAGQVGVPVELAYALEAGNPDVRVTFEAWLDGAGTPWRLAYVVSLAALEDDEGRERLPARIVRGTYDLREHGLRVDVDVPPAGG